MPESLPEPLIALRSKTESLIRDGLTSLEEALNDGLDLKTIRERAAAYSTDAGIFSMTQPESYSGERSVRLR
jgi:hypothetical protein